MQIAPVVLSGRVVRLEPYKSENFEEIAAAALSAPEIFRFIPSRMQTRADLVERFAMVERVMNAGGGVFFVTRLSATGELVGSTSMILTDAAHRRLEIGFTWILPRMQRSAVNTEAKLLQLTHAFETLGAVRVEFKTDARNEKSRNALLGIGAREEGVLRSHMICWDGHRRDSVYFSILDTEWPTVKARLTARLDGKSRR
jgi:RimJ/RimL family protein N-acetyltransferase